MPAGSRPRGKPDLSGGRRTPDAPGRHERADIAPPVPPAVPMLPPMEPPGAAWPGSRRTDGARPSANGVPQREFGTPDLPRGQPRLSVGRPAEGVPPADEPRGRRRREQPGAAEGPPSAPPTPPDASGQVLGPRMSAKLARAAAEETMARQVTPDRAPRPAPAPAGYWPRVRSDRPHVERAYEGAQPGTGATPPGQRAPRLAGPVTVRRRHRQRKGEGGSLLRELPILVGVALLLALLIKTFLVQAFYIPSDSMENTLKVGDRVLVNKLGNYFGDIDRGEIVVFRDPGGWLGSEDSSSPGNPVVRAVKNVFVFIGLLPSDSEKDLIKRVIGVPGDRVKCCDSAGRITVNGVPLDEPYVFPGNTPSDSTFDVTVPEGRLWMMGDHRAVSADSRLHLGEASGTIPMDNVIGRAFLVVWPFGRAGTLPVPDTFHQKALDAAGVAGGLGQVVTTAATAPLLPGLTVTIPLSAFRLRRRVGRSL